ncbi:tRNA methyltransferase 10 homolog A-like isoform X2 [Mercenaria mercenaria]|uniref:tRNA methyltransferase 10 homolog A-like isoform X2 n=1 Tax=Mercenaria mercenaria TaxID=6596 RepID=UPI00234F4849|nr:tRNA methyltransferase 10 homolog A-like isoform X2 [Mercenaria mercenaria]
MSAPIEMSEETQRENINDKAHTAPGAITVEEDGSNEAEGKNKAEVAETGGATLSKSQLKKLKKKEKWEQVKSQKRKAEKERHKARKRACRERGEEVGPTRKQLRHNKMSKSNCKIKVVVDCDFDDYMAEKVCDFDDYMAEKDIKMLVKQLQYSYSANRRAENPLQFYCCGVNGKTKERLENIGDYKGWDIRFHSESYTDKFEKSSIVYLSSESTNILQTLEEDKVYVIGGLVDHNHHKGLCHKLAEEKGLAHAQLPISDYIDMKTRKVLTVNHVFEILLHYTETKDWQKAFYTVLPPRKGAVLKPPSSSEIVKNISASQENIDTESDCNDDQLETSATQTVQSKQLHSDVSEDASADCESVKRESEDEHTSADCESVKRISVDEHTSADCESVKRVSVDEHTSADCDSVKRESVDKHVNNDGESVKKKAVEKDDPVIVT